MAQRLDTTAGDTPLVSRLEQGLLRKTNTIEPNNKRSRDLLSTSTETPDTLDPSPDGSPAKAARLALASFLPQVNLTGAAALEDQRRELERQRQAQPAISENRGYNVIKSLMSGTVQAMSRPEDAARFAPTAPMEPLSKSPTSLSTTNNVPRVDEPTETGSDQGTALGGNQVVESPTPMDVDHSREHLTPDQTAQEDRAQPNALSYPPLQVSAALSEQPSRGMSYPMPSQNSPNSAGNKKHKCPYCGTEFTRHHNLKSHLLTHSQEKPYVCTQCNLRFRRLHDLKRHGKLHTGEKPHICHKCDRKFARGDALARHNKGAGGCPGRRSSMGSFADDTEMDTSLADTDESTMSGIPYTGAEEDDLRRQTLPGAAQHAVAQSEQYSAHSRSYPPTDVRPITSSLYGGSAGQSQTSNSTGSNSLGSAHTPNTSISSMQVGTSGTGPGMYSQSGISESPRALSPGVAGHDLANANRPRSPQSAQHQPGRKPSDLHSPHNSRPKLPGLAHSSFAAPGPGFQHSRSPGAGESGNMFAQSDPSVWAYVQSLEEKLKQLTEKVSGLENEVTSLKRQQEEKEPVPAN